jgi:hypothetical protein
MAKQKKKAATKRKRTAANNDRALEDADWKARYPKAAPEPWEQQPRESAKAFQAFVMYRDMGVQRSVLAVGRALGKSRQLLDKWSQLHMWTERAQTSDAMMQRHEMEAQIEARKERAVRQVKMARRFQDIAAAKLNSPKFAGKVRQPRDVLAYGRVGIQLEREICGDAQHKEQPPPPVHINMFAQIKIETERMRAKILQEFVDKGRLTQEQADILMERGAHQQALFAPTRPASEVVIDSPPPHPSEASCAHDPALQPAPDPAAEQPGEPS